MCLKNVVGGNRVTLNTVTPTNPIFVPLEYHGGHERSKNADKPDHQHFF